MEKNTVCEMCGCHFTEGDGIYVVKPNDGEEYHLCPECFEKKYNGDPEFKAFWDEDTRVLQMDDEELEDEFGSDSAEEIGYCSYYTEFQEDGDDEDC